MSAASVPRAAKLSIRLARMGCANRPFYHIVVMAASDRQQYPPIEQLGVYDPMVNEVNEKIVSFNFERIKYWIAKDAQISDPVAELLGLSGFLPIHPNTYMTAWRNRRKAREEAEKAAQQAAAAEEAKESAQA